MGIRIEIIVTIADRAGLAPPTIRLRKALKTLWRAHGVKAVSIRPMPDRSVPRPEPSASRPRLNADLRD